MGAACGAFCQIGPRLARRRQIGSSASTTTMGSRLACRCASGRGNLDTPSLGKAVCFALGLRRHCALIARRAPAEGSAPLPLSDSLQPEVRSTLCAGHCHNVDYVVVDAEEHDVWEPRQHLVSKRSISAPKRVRKRGIQNLVKCTIHDRDQLDSEPRSLRLVPFCCPGELLFGLGKDTQYRHAWPSRFRIRARTSVHSEAFPPRALAASARRSSSPSHAASQSGA